MIELSLPDSKNTPLSIEEMYGEGSKTIELVIAEARRLEQGSKPAPHTYLGKSGYTQALSLQKRLSELWRAVPVPKDFVTLAELPTNILPDNEVLRLADLPIGAKVYFYVGLRNLPYCIQVVESKNNVKLIRISNFDGSNGTNFIAPLTAVCSVTEPKGILGLPIVHGQVLPSVLKSGALIKPPYFYPTYTKTVEKGHSQGYVGTLRDISISYPRK